MHVVYKFSIINGNLRWRVLLTEVDGWRRSAILWVVWLRKGLDSCACQTSKTAQKGVPVSRHDFQPNETGSIAGDVAFVLNLTLPPEDWGWCALRLIRGVSIQARAVHRYSRGLQTQTTGPWEQLAQVPKVGSAEPYPGSSLQFPFVSFLAK